MVIFIFFSAKISTDILICYYYHVGGDVAGSVQCDDTMRAADGVYAAGDIARYPYVYDDD